MKRALLLFLVMLVGYAWAGNALTATVQPPKPPAEPEVCVIPKEIDLVCSMQPVDGDASAFYVDCIDRYRNVYHFIVPRGNTL